MLWVAPVIAVLAVAPVDAVADVDTFIGGRFRWKIASSEDTFVGGRLRRGTVTWEDSFVGGSIRSDSMHGHKTPNRMGCIFHGECEP